MFNFFSLYFKSYQCHEVLVLEAMILVLEVALGMLAMVPAVGFLVSHSSVKNILNSQNPRI